MSMRGRSVASRHFATARAGEAPTRAMWSVIDYSFGVSDDARVEARVEEIKTELAWRRFYVATACYLLGFFLLAFDRLMRWAVDEPREDEESRRLTRQEMDKEWEDLRKRVKRRQDRLRATLAFLLRARSWLPMERPSREQGVTTTLRVRLNDATTTRMTTVPDGSGDDATTTAANMAQRIERLHENFIKARKTVEELLLALQEEARAVQADQESLKQAMQEVRDLSSSMQERRNQPTTARLVPRIPYSRTLGSEWGKSTLSVDEFERRISLFRVKNAHNDERTHD